MTTEFEEDYSVSSKLDSTFQQTGLIFKHTIESLKGEKDLSRSTRRARTMKNIEDSFDEDKHHSKVFAQTSPCKFLSTQNKSQKFINFKSKD